MRLGAAVREEIVEHWDSEAAPVLHNFSLFGWADGTAAPSYFGEYMAFADPTGITALLAVEVSPIKPGSNI